MKRLSNLFVLSLLLVLLSCDNESYDGPLFAPPTCEEASDRLLPIQEEFENANANNYSELCEEYKTALEDVISACSEEDSAIQALLSELGDCELSSFFQVDFEGQTFLADQAEASLSQGEISIKGLRGTNGETIELIVNSDSEGTYDLGVSVNSQTNVGLYSPDSNNVNVWQSINESNLPQGQITISEIDYFNSKISGTFNFTAYNEVGEVKDFTSGLFVDIPLEKENDFFAMVDGVEFVDTQIVPGINNFGWIGLSAISNDNHNIFIAVRYNATPGTYALNQDTEQTRFSYSPSDQVFFYGEGSVTVLVHNPESNFLMGTFSCMALPQLNATGSYEITEGKFCLTYFDGAFDDE